MHERPHVKSGAWRACHGRRRAAEGAVWRHATSARNSTDAAHADPAGHVERKADLLAFGKDGRFMGGRFGVVATDASRDVIGAGMVFQPSATAGEDRLLVAAACPDLAGGAEDRLCVQHYRISTTADGLPAVVADGAPRVDSWSLKTARATP